MKPREYKITGIPNNLLLTNPIDQVKDIDLACMLIGMVKTSFGGTFHLEKEQLN